MAGPTSQWEEADLLSRFVGHRRVFVKFPLLFRLFLGFFFGQGLSMSHLWFLSAPFTERQVFFWVLLGLTGFDWVLLGFTGFD